MTFVSAGRQIRPVNVRRQRVVRCAGCGARMKVNKNSWRHVSCDACRGLVERWYAGNRI